MAALCTRGSIYSDPFTSSLAWLLIHTKAFNATKAGDGLCSLHPLRDMGVCMYVDEWLGRGDGEHIRFNQYFLDTLYLMSGLDSNCLPEPPLLLRPEGNLGSF